MWPFRKREETAADRLFWRRADTPEGQAIVSRAYEIARKRPDWTEGQCIRAAILNVVVMGENRIGMVAGYIYFIDIVG